MLMSGVKATSGCIDDVSKSNHNLLQNAVNKLFYYEIMHLSFKLRVFKQQSSIFNAIVKFFRDG